MTIGALSAFATGGLLVLLFVSISFNYVSYLIHKLVDTATMTDLQPSPSAQCHWIVLSPASVLGLHPGRLVAHQHMVDNPAKHRNGPCLYCPR
jgi:hypothetical protein